MHQAATGASEGFLCLSSFSRESRSRPSWQRGQADRFNALWTRARPSRFRLLLHLGRDIAFNCLELRIRQWQLPQSNPMLSGLFPRIAPLEPYRTRLRPSWRMGRVINSRLSRHWPMPVTPEVSKKTWAISPIVLRNRIYEYAERLIDCRIVIAAGASTMSNLHGNTCNLW